MTTSQEHPRTGHPDDNFSEFAEELRLLAEAVLERVEPVLRRTAADGRVQWDSCSWCPVCAAAAVVRGEHHDVVAAIADHGTAIVTVLREALAGVPVEPLIPPDLDPDSPEYHAWLHDSYGHGHAPEQRFGMRDPRAGSDSAAPGGDAGTDSADSAADPAFGAADSGAPGADSGARGGDSSARGAAHGGAVAGLGGLLAKFAAGAQAVAAERRARGHDSAAAGWSGTAAARDTAPERDAGARERPDSAATAEPAAAETTGEDPLGRGPGTARRPGEAGSGRADQRQPGPGAERPAGRGGRGARSGYVPIDVTIKA
ncbi:hypothetical protein ABZ319_35480 [Nocardia sp. NPDC005978]|uniref:hypothetical protein n=1 Tax=Nocardia sp. NPDC005978 TaxID=3156725 RepID=UPI0033AB65E6